MIRLWCVAAVVGTSLLAGLGGAPVRAADKDARPDPEALFKKLDTDKDGKISKDEFKALFTDPKPALPARLKANVKLQDELFQKYDSDKDGFIDLDEFKALWEELEKLADNQRHTDEAVRQLSAFEAAAQRNRPVFERRWRAGYAAGMVGVAEPVPGPLPVATLLAYRASVGDCYGLGSALPRPPGVPPRSQACDWLAVQGLNDFMNEQDFGPPSVALLAVGAARRAVAASPREPLGYLWLEQAYLRLHDDTRERAWSQRMPPLNVLRQVQMVTALQHALELQTDLTPAQAALLHTELAKLYERFRSAALPDGYLDVEMEHRRKALEILQQAGDAGRQPGEEAKQYRKRLDDLEKEVKDLEKKVQTQENTFEVRSDKMPVLNRAQLALQSGLPNKALDILLKSDVVEFGVPGAQLELELMLTLGQAGKVREWLKDIKKGDLGSVQLTPEATVPAYEWYSFLGAAAVGDYKEADRQLDELVRLKEPPPAGRMAVAYLLGDILLETARERSLPAEMTAEIQRFDTTIQLHRLAQLLIQQRVQQMDLLTLRGLLALEVGDTGKAGQHFRAALSLSNPPERTAPLLTGLGASSPLEGAAALSFTRNEMGGSGLDFRARPIALRYLELLEEQGR